MEHRYKLENIFKNYLSLKGIPYHNMELAPMVKGSTMNGTAYRDSKGFYMPVTFKANGKAINFPYAVLSISQKKSIVSTQLQGRTGTVKELISISDADIDLTGMMVDDFGNYPEHDVTTIKELFEINKSIEITCPLTDIILGVGTEVVIESISYPSLGGVENAQVVKMKLITDKSFELCLS